MVEKLSKKILIWKTKDKEIKIKNLKELLDVLINIKQEDIDKEINNNIANLSKWIETDFPEQIELIENIKKSIKEFTPQQIRESIIRSLRKIPSMEKMFRYGDKLKQKKKYTTKKVIDLSHSLRGKNKK